MLGLEMVQRQQWRMWIVPEISCAFTSKRGEPKTLCTDSRYDIRANSGSTRSPGHLSGKFYLSPWSLGSLQANRTPATQTPPPSKYYRCPVTGPGISDFTESPMMPEGCQGHVATLLSVKIHPPPQWTWRLGTFYSESVGFWILLNCFGP